MSSSTPSQQNLSEENDTPTTTTTVFGKFENPELDFPIKVGHVLYKLKKNSIKKVSEWATAHNGRIGFPEVSMNVIKCIRRKKLKFHCTQLKYVFLAENAHGQGQRKNVPASSEDAVPASSEDAASASSEDPVPASSEDAASASSFLPQPSCEDCQAKEIKIESITEELNALKKELESVRKENSNLKKELEAKNKKILTHNTIRKLY